jgi:prepilin-type N-terminal cleavage/methylation domain-containing protein
MDKGMRIAFRLLPVTRALPSSRRRRSSRRRSSRGFTLTETLAALAMISVLVVASSPTFVRLMRDRRVNRASMHLVDYYRTGYTRAMGRGQPMLVIWDTASGLDNAEPGTKGLIRLVEPIVFGGVAVKNCQTTQWTNVGEVQEVSRVDFKSGRYANTSAIFYDDVTPPGVRSYSEICFMPTGRAYIRYAPGTPFQPLTGVASFVVTNTDTNLTRTVFVPPNGVARMQL